MFKRQTPAKILTVMAVLLTALIHGAPASAGLIFDIYIGAEYPDGTEWQAPGGWISLPGPSGDTGAGVELEVDFGTDPGAIYDGSFDEAAIWSIEWLLSPDLSQLEVLNLILDESKDCDLIVYPTCSSQSAAIFISDGEGTWDYGATICSPEEPDRCVIFGVIPDGLVARTSPVEMPLSPTPVLLILGLALLLRQLRQPLAEV